MARALLALLLVVAAGLWLGALLASSASMAPALLVYGEPRAAPGSVWPVRIVAIWAAEARQAAFEGEVSTPSERARVKDGVARVKLPAVGERVELVVSGTADGRPVSANVSVRLASDAGRAPEPRFLPWTTALAANTAKDRAGPPLYPVSGTQPSTLPGELLVLAEEAIQLHELAPNAAGVASPDGRALRLDRSGLVIRVPPVASAGEPIEVGVRSASAASLHVDLIVNGRVREMRALEVTRGDNALALALPDDAEAGWYAVHAVASPLASARGPVALGLIVPRETPRDPAALVSALLRQPFLTSAQDPLLGRLSQQPPSDLRPLRAVLARLRIDEVRPPNLAASPRAQQDAALLERRHRVERFRGPFRLAGGAFALLAMVVATLAMRQSQAWREESGAREARQLAPALWGALALVASLAALWVLDWAIGFMLGSGTA